MRAVFLLAVLASCLGAPAAPEVLASTPVPNAWMRQGEVRLVRDGATTVVVESVLRTRFLDRVVHHIVEQEQANWSAEHPAATTYLARLQDVAAALKKQGRGPHALTIRFEVVADQARVRLIHPAPGNAPPVTHELHLPPNYVRRNQALILQDAFKDDASRVLTRLKALHEEMEHAPE